MTVRPPDHLDLIASAPEGIQKLRGLILELAVRGKLVPQDLKDEPASELLKRIAKERARLEAEGKIKKSKPLPPVGEDEQPFARPVSWAWVRLSEVTTKITDGTHHSPPNLPSGSFKYISAKNIKSWGIDQSGMTFVTQAIHDEIYSRCNPEFGDVLYIKDGATTGVAAINTLEEPFSMLSSVALLKPSIGLFNRYLYFLMTSPVFYDEMRAGMTGVAITRVTLAKLNAAVLPLPPLAEQHRIVAKVDELMALCDELEQKVGAGETAHTKLVETLLGTLTQRTDAADLTANWQRLAEHFDTLFTTESSLDALKQTVLQLAVMGKLVPQDPNEEPASELLKRIAKERARLEAEGKIKKSKPLVLVGEDDQPFEVPDGWVWTRFAQVATVNGRLVDSQDHPDAMQVAPDSIEKGTGRLIDRRTVRDAGVRGPNQRFRAGQLLYSKIRPSLSKVVIVDFEGLCSADMYPLDPYIEPRFLLNQILSEVFLEQVRVAENRVKMPKLNQESLRAILVCVPPLAEQHRIVAKVDELMALCDRLKVDLAESRTRQERLATTLIDTALKAA